jgi:hypothetical protein
MDCGCEICHGERLYKRRYVAVLRIAECLIFAGELKSAFCIGMDRTIITVIVVRALNLELLLLKPRESYSQ